MLIVILTFMDIYLRLATTCNIVIIQAAGFPSQERRIVTVTVYTYASCRSLDP